MNAQAEIKDRLDLLPKAFRRKMLRHARRRQWSIILGTCAVLSLAVCIIQHYEYQYRQQELEARRLRAAPIESLQSQTVELRKRLAKLRDEQQLRSELESEQLAFHLLATVSRSAAACVDGVQVQQFTFSRTRSTVTTAPSNADGQPRPPEQTEIESLVMTVKGIGADNLMVSRFVVALRDSQVFEKVDLKSSVGSAAAGHVNPGNGGQARSLRSFIVECTL